MSAAKGKPQGSWHGARSVLRGRITSAIEMRVIADAALLIVLRTVVAGPVVVRCAGATYGVIWVSIAFTDEISLAGAVGNLAKLHEHIFQLGIWIGIIAVGYFRCRRPKHACVPIRSEGL